MKDKKDRETERDNLKNRERELARQRERDNRNQGKERVVNNKQ